MTKDFIGEHYLDPDIVVEIDKVWGELTITSYTKNTGRRRFERVKLKRAQLIELKQMLNETI